LFCLRNFAYVVGNCLVNALQVSFHFRYTSTEIREGIIEHFRTCLQKQDKKEIASYQLDLSICSLVEMHKISDLDEYLNQMTRLTSINITPHDRVL